jgi:hypothetical protein
MKWIKKFESYRDYNTKVFDVDNMSIKESINIKNLIDSILLDLYKDNIVKIKGFDELFVAPIHGEDKNKLKSFLNYANTNQKLLQKLSDIFKLKSYYEIYDFIKRNKNHLFLKEGKWFNIVKTSLEYTIRIGEENEKYALSFLNNFFDLDFSKRTDTDYEDDLINGIDIYFKKKGDDKVYTVQVKPFFSTKTINDNITINSSGVVKEYKTDYYIFVNRKYDKVFMFYNDLPKIYKKSYIFKKTSLVVEK